MLLLSAGVATPVAQDRDVSSSFTDLTGEMCTRLFVDFSAISIYLKSKGAKDCNFTVIHNVSAD
jgi:hypothetical protein